MSELSQNKRLDDPEVQALFFEKLSATCNVTKAAKAADISTGTLYRRRKTNTQFRLDWEAAIAEGYDRLELLMMERVLVGTTRTTRRWR
ncbi:hypothetical protein [Sphingomicrobium sediminis]|uniref:DNA binding HTH domain-containing protein n=1 Tax=Sphingomicrobium sediminis TaxID=2950949 RepID=A0A9X2EEC4_9SPHN|nr:hypothetical protein [Sphingomicrobium sediminis]MCM8556383.1 hypothetical protein [Sphingomicrobium sediminis]